MEELRICGNKIARIMVANIVWPLFDTGATEVPRRMDYLCQPYANEESTLVTSGPSILYNNVYQSNALLMTVKNRVYRWDITQQLRHVKGKCQVPQKPPVQLSPSGVVTSLGGRSLSDHAASKSTVQVSSASGLASLSHNDSVSQMTLHKEMLFVHSSYNTITSVRVL